MTTNWLLLSLLGIPVGALAGMWLAFWWHYRPGGVADQIEDEWK